MDLADPPSDIQIPMITSKKSYRKALSLIDDVWFTDATKVARWMDLLGDYAGVEPFVIDGEALFQVVLDDPLLAIGRDSDSSFQILHAYYLLEMLLEQFKRRNANFEIVFWKENRHLTTKTGDSPLVVASRALARAMLFAHLLKLEFKVHVFFDQNDDSWKRYCYDRKPMFVMTNDGGLSDENATELQASRAFQQRSFLLGILSSGISVALLKGAEFRDSKILSFVFESHSSSLAKLHLALSPIIRKAQRDLATSLFQHFDDDDGESNLRLATVADGQEQMNDVEIFRDILRSTRASVEPEIAYLFIAHSLLTSSLSIHERAQPLTILPAELQANITGVFLPRVFAHAANLFTSGRGCMGVDGRIFSALIHVVLLKSCSLSEVIGSRAYAEAQHIWEGLPGPAVDFAKFTTRYGNTLGPSYSPSTIANLETYHLLPFSHPVFDKQLAGVYVETEGESAEAPSSPLPRSPATTFRDTRHWHNQKSILPPHLGGSRPSGPPNPRKLKADQRFMSSMQDLAATLTGASGGMLQRIVIPPVPTNKGEQRQKVSYARESKTAGKAKTLSKADSIRLENQKKKDAEFKSESLAWWARQLSEISSQSLPERIKKLEDLGRSPRMAVREIALERKLCLLDADFRTWIADPERESPSAKDLYSVSVMRKVKELCEQEMLPQSVCKIITSALTALSFYDHFHSTTSKIAPEDQRLKLSFIKLVDRKSGSPLYPFMVINEHPIIWQLRLFGDYMDRSMDSTYDKRVPFKPDEWQRRVLDGIDQKKSLLVVAPTSAGKTFISFYAMEQVLRESNDGILVYIAPTKALVSQIAAEVYARFSKSMNGKSCWAIHTRDYRIHEPMDCQILITVPEILGILLLSPDCARVWTPRLRRIILDEIHTIGQQEGGSIWEQIILLAPCPIIGLSATIGSPEVFSDWLGSVQETHGIQYEFIEHRTRYSHLRKFFYASKVGQQKFLGLDRHVDSKRSLFLHPVGLLAFGCRTLPPDFSLEAGDTLTLWEKLASVKGQLAATHDLTTLQPTTFFSSNRDFLLQADVLRYEGRLKALLTDFIKSWDPRDASTPIGQVVLSLQGGQQTEDKKVPKNFGNDLLDLLAGLHVKDQLPAILFNFDRSNCEFLAKTLFRALEIAEQEWRSEDPNWKARVRQWNIWKEREKLRERTTAKQQRKKTVDDEDRDVSHSWEASFNPKDPSPQFSFANPRSYSYSDLETDLVAIAWACTSIPWALNALRRGIAVHHAGMNKQYRSLIESLFRRGFIRVMISTGTLALGINAPAKTSVFCGDSPFLTALMYRQCSGRAGRRGFDLRGNVVFYNLPLDRARRLVLSRLPPLTGNFPLTFTLTLRMFSLLDGSENAEVAVRAVRSLLSLPQVSLSSQIGHHQLLHYIRFSIEYLRRAELLDDVGRPLNHFTLANHLYYTEPSNFALIALIRSGVIRTICNQPDAQQAKKDFMIVLCNLFGRRNLSRIFGRKSNIDALTKELPSMIVLPPLPEIARTALLDHDKQILQIFQGYALAYATQYAATLGPDVTLPLSKLQYAAKSGDIQEDSVFLTHLKENAIRPSIRSLFVATSGIGDSFHSVLELTQTALSGLKLYSHAIPSMSQFVVGPDNEYDILEHGLNAYILDFWIHGQVTTLARANGIRRGDIWYNLQDFYLTLLAIRASLQQLITETSGVETSPFATAPDVLFDPAESEPLPDDDKDIDEAAIQEDTSTAESSDSTLVSTLSTSGATRASGLNAHARRLKHVGKADWRVYEVLDSVCTEFGEKFKAMWA
ncbi:unnamed protein product [Cyclocybe aegerita]|uniref:P-loop containing nucleoside triphosphate hydrolase protein n=1 Tax=Cyclocybe aegerita TaxID=1973307 RepID=A0A8S0WG13_CYCAE|nr:unnamed protein product [Cyclocybe aegerita]